MKIFSLATFIATIVSFFFAMYEKLILGPKDVRLYKLMDNGFADGITRRVWYTNHNLLVNIGMALVVVCGILLVLNIVSAVKSKNKMNYIGVILSLFGFVIGLIYGTHLFS